MPQRLCSGLDRKTAGIAGTTQRELVNKTHPYVRSSTLGGPFRTVDFGAENQTSLATAVRFRAMRLC